jgi:type II secretory pathway pseudopilin PulG
MSLELRSPNVLSLLQSPMPLTAGGEDLFRSPGFGTLVTPPWAKCGSSGGSKTMAKTGPAAAQAEAEEQEEDRRHSVARRLDSAPTFADFAEAAAAVVAQQAQQVQQAAQQAQQAAQQAQQAQQGAAGSLQTAASFEFGALLGSPPKKSKTCSPPEASQGTCATAGTPWMAHTGHSSLALAVQQHLLLASTAKAPAVAGTLGAELRDKENGRGGTLTALKAGPAGGSVVDKEPISSSKVRQQLTALLDSV